MAVDVIFNILFFVIIFCFLTYSCQWFGRTLKNYQDARRAFEEHELARQTRQSTDDNRFSVYTIEHGRRTLINYPSAMPPRSPATVIMKEDFPPNYDDALKMPQAPASPSAPPTFMEISALPNQRRNSSIL